MNANNLVKSADVMRFFGYTTRAAFWSFVNAKGVPCVRLNARRIMFDPGALNAWIARHSTDTEPRKFVFEAQKTPSQ